MRKISTPLTLITLLCCSSLIACGGADKSEAGDDGNTETAGTSEAEDEGMDADAEAEGMDADAEGDGDGDAEGDGDGDGEGDGDGDGEGDGDGDAEGDGDGDGEGDGDGDDEGDGDGDGDGEGDGDGDNDQCGVIIATIRDFSVDHPDFQAFSGAAPTLGLVLPTLGPDQKPVYSGTGAALNQMTSEENFNQWYNDVPDVNFTFQVELALEEIEPGLFSYNNQTFFPIDDLGFGNQGSIDSLGDSHNFHFTTEIHTSFVYQPGQIFTFIGDDDLWLFIDGQLAIDLGGLHPAAMDTIDLDELGLTPGQQYSMDIFHAERRTNQSTFRIDTSIQCFFPQ